MTMSPDPWPPRHAQRFVLHMEEINRRRDPLRPAFDDEEEVRETFGGMIIAAVIGWLLITATIAVILVVL